MTWWQARAQRSDSALGSAGASYFSYVSMLNQLVFMSTQMYHDACNPQHHKYMAHQIALLYVRETSGLGWPRASKARAGNAQQLLPSCLSPAALTALHALHAAMPEPASGRDEAPAQGDREPVR